MLEQKHHALLNELRRQRRETANVHLFFEVLALASAIDRDCAARLACHGLSEGRFVLLFLLRAAGGGLSPHELAERAGVTRGTITGLLDGLERDGLAVRGGQPARRSPPSHGEAHVRWCEDGQQALQ